MQGEPAQAAWRQWVSQADFDNLDAGSMRLLPLLYRNLEKVDPGHPLLPKLKGTYRKTWCRNQLLFDRMTGLLGALQAAGIETMVLKGGALIPLHYLDFGLRPMQDFDILVPFAQAGPAIEVLTANGYVRHEHTPGEKSLDWLLANGHGGCFQDSSGQEVDLHWHLLPQCVQEDADEDLWLDGVTTVIHGLPVRALNSADQLLHVCAHGLEVNQVPPIRWVADAMIVLRTAAIDWPRLVGQAERRRLTLKLSDALSYLRRALAADIPAEVLLELLNKKLPLAERLVHKIETATWRPGSPVGLLAANCRGYLATARTELQDPSFTGYLRYVQARFDVPYLWMVPGHMAFRAVRTTIRSSWLTLRR